MINRTVIQPTQKNIKIGDTVVPYSTSNKKVYHGKIRGAKYIIKSFRRSVCFVDYVIFYRLKLELLYLILCSYNILIMQTSATLTLLKHISIYFTYLQNMRMRFICNVRKFNHISEFNWKRKWFPIRYRRNRHILQFLYRILLNPATTIYFE